MPFSSKRLSQKTKSKRFHIKFNIQTGENDKILIHFAPRTLKSKSNNKTERNRGNRPMNFYDQTNSVLLL